MKNIIHFFCIGVYIGLISGFSESPTISIILTTLLSLLVLILILSWGAKIKVNGIEVDNNVVNTKGLEKVGMIHTFVFGIVIGLVVAVYFKNSLSIEEYKINRQLTVLSNLLEKYKIDSDKPHDANHLSLKQQYLLKLVSNIDTDNVTSLSIPRFFTYKSEATDCINYLKENVDKPNLLDIAKELHNPFVDSLLESNKDLETFKRNIKSL